MSAPSEADLAFSRSLIAGIQRSHPRLNISPNNCLDRLARLRAQIVADAAAPLLVPRVGPMPPEAARASIAARAQARDAQNAAP